MVFSSRGSASGDNNYELLNDFFLKNFSSVCFSVCLRMHHGECTSEHLKLPKFPERALPQCMVMFSDPSSAHVYSAFSAEGSGTKLYQLQGGHVLYFS